MPEIDCRPHVQACSIRVTRLAANGAPLVGATNMYVSDALVTMGFTSVYTDGEEIEDRNACGIVVVNYRGADTFKRGDVELTLTTPDPYLSEILSGGDVINVTGPPAVKGFAAPAIGPVTGNGIGIELWAHRVDDGSDDADYPYAHWLYPRIKNLRIGDHEHANASLQPAFSGQAYQNDNWGDGPVGDWPATSDRVYQWIPATSMPTPTCDYQAVLADV
jgi:hypothetical protein